MTSGYRHIQLLLLALLAVLLCRHLQHAPAELAGCLAIVCYLAVSGHRRSLALPAAWQS